MLVPQAQWQDFWLTWLLPHCSSLPSIFLLLLGSPISCGGKNEINNWSAIVGKMGQQRPHPSTHYYSYNFQRISEWKEMIKRLHSLFWLLLSIGKWLNYNIFIFVPRCTFLKKPETTVTSLPYCSRVLGLCHCQPCLILSCLCCLRSTLLLVVQIYESHHAKLQWQWTIIKQIWQIVQHVRLVAVISGI